MSVTTNKTLALRYRPQKLEDVCGHSAVVKTLAGIFKSQEVPNAIMFCGTSGCGKTTFARMVNRYLNCEKGNSCGKCKSCSFPGDQHPDYLEVNGGELLIDGAKALIGKANFAPRFNIRVILIDECHLVATKAAELLLKTLEEPPASTLWVLATTHPEKIPNYKAIMGRCSIMALNPPSKEEISGRLAAICEKEKLDFDEKILLTIAEASGGQVRDAVQILDNTQRFVKGSKDKLDKKELRKHILEQAMQISSQEADVLAMKALLCVYTQKPEHLVPALMETKDYVPLINSMSFLNQYMIANTCCPDNKSLWHTAQAKALWTAVAKRMDSGMPLTRLLLIHDALTKLRDEVVTSQANTLHQITARLGVLAIKKTKAKK